MLGLNAAECDSGRPSGQIKYLELTGNGCQFMQEVVSRMSSNRETVNRLYIMTLFSL